MQMKVYLTSEEVAAAVTDYLMMKGFRVSEVYDSQLSLYEKMLRVTLSNEAAVEVDEEDEHD